MQELIRQSKPHMTFEEWLEELALVTSNETKFPIDECRRMIRAADARTWYDDGFTPYATFRETYANENDTE